LKAAGGKVDTGNNTAAVNSSVRALTRFWWLVVAGIIIGAAVAVVVYKLEAKPKYTATTSLFVNSPNAPYLRTQQAPTATSTVQPSKKSQAVTKYSVAQSTPDTQTLVNAANTFPLLIQSDPIARVRQEHYGALQGTVTANALNATTNSYGVFRPSPLPVIQVKATANHASTAEQLADATVGAFQIWMKGQQDEHGIPRSDRISVQQLSAPTVETTGGRSKGLPLFLGVIVLLAFCGLAIMLDHQRPASAESRTEEAPGPAQHSLES
jgi:capsular polysaccharide biosynthesis protein